MNDMRSEDPAPALERNGFQVMDMASEMRYADFEDEKKVTDVYLAEVERALMKELGAGCVHVMDFAVSLCIDFLIICCCCFFFGVWMKG